ncbi:hypothetical protein [Paenibacillus sp. R14(2021)]|nr:hypothetical protein [Paenibacillus sp. R14(2021)]
MSELKKDSRVQRSHGGVVFQEATAQAKSEEPDLASSLRGYMI